MVVMGRPASAPSLKAGKGCRTLWPGPGPGAYRPEDATAGKRPGCVSFGKPNRRSSGRMQMPKWQSPGPAYNVRDSNTQHICGGAVGVRFQLANQVGAGNPGPGNCAPLSTLALNGPVMGEPQRVRPKSAPSGTPLFAGQPDGTKPAYSIGKGLRPPLNPSLGAPDADQFMPTSTLGGAAASCRAGGAPEFGRFEVRPEPTTYNPRRLIPSAACRFSTAARPSSAPPGGRTADGGIGPGHYNTSVASHCGGPRLDSRARRSDAGGRDGGAEAGPGTYTLDGALGGSCATFGRASRAVSSSVAPGGLHQSVLENAVAAVAAEALQNRGGKMVDSAMVVNVGRGPRFPRAQRK